MRTRIYVCICVLAFIFAICMFSAADRCIAHCPSLYFEVVTLASDLFIHLFISMHFAHIKCAPQKSYHQDYFIVTELYCSVVLWNSYGVYRQRHVCRIYRYIKLITRIDPKNLMSISFSCFFFCATLYNGRKKTFPTKIFVSRASPAFSMNLYACIA